MLKNFSKIDTYRTNDSWNSLDYDEKLSLLDSILIKHNFSDVIDIKKIINNDQIIAKLKKNHSSTERGTLLLDIEEKIKQNIDLGLNLWLEPIGDKNSLRNLRGIKISHE